MEMSEIKETKEIKEENNSIKTETKEENIPPQSEIKEEKIPLPKYGKHKIESCKQKFKSFFIDNIHDLPKMKQTIINLAINSSLQPELIRPTAWKIFLKTLTYNDNLTIKDWLEETYNKRNEFKKKLNSLKEEYEAAKSGDSSKFSNFEENSSIVHLIEIDVERTYGDIKLFQDKYVRKMEEEILYVFAKENKPISYKQGMNEILAIFIHSFFPFYFTCNKKVKDKKEFDLWSKEPNKYLNEIYEYLHDEDEFQSDLYYIMYNVMNIGLNKFYDDSNDLESPKEDPKTHLLLRCDNILLKLKKHNTRLYQHFMDIQLSAEIILQRWLKCIFTREFTTEDCILIWDNILANEFNIPSKNLEYIDYFCVAMFDYIGEDLLKHDQNECFLCLFKYPPFQTIDILITSAERVKANILKLDAQKDSIFSNLTSKFKDKFNNINISVPFFNKKNSEEEQRKKEQKKEDILAELKQLTDNKARIKQLKTILNKYKSKFYDDDKMKIDMILNTLEKNV